MNGSKWTFGQKARRTSSVVVLLDMGVGPALAEAVEAALDPSCGWFNKVASRLHWRLAHAVSRGDVDHDRARGLLAGLAPSDVAKALHSTGALVWHAEHFPTLSRATCALDARMVGALLQLGAQGDVHCNWCQSRQ